MRREGPLPVTYTNLTDADVRAFKCGHCGREVAANKGWNNSSPSYHNVLIRICPMCGRPNYFEADYQMPRAKAGNTVNHLPKDVESLYEEIREVMAANAPTSATLGLRKLLMHIAVEKGAAVGQTFQQYVSFFESQRLVPIGAKDWVDHIRTKSNEANHEIVTISMSDAEELLLFAEMLLKLIYEFPARLPKKP